MADPAYRVLAHLDSVRKTSANQWEAVCPCHGDSKPSLSISVGADDRALLYCHAGCHYTDVLRVLGLPISALHRERLDRPAKSKSNAAGDGKPKGKVVARYAYHGPDGALRFWVVRFAPKDFRQCRPDDSGLGVIWKGPDESSKCLYHSDEIARADIGETVYICEGEKDVDRLRQSGFLSTTNPGGADPKGGKWLPQYTEQLRGRPVVIIPDVDAPHPTTGRCTGQDHAAAIAHALVGVAASVRLLALPPTGLVPKWDVSDWIDRGGTKAQFLEAVVAAPEFNPADHPLPANASPGSSTAPGDVNESDDDPHRLARIFADAHKHPDGLTIRFHRETWYRWISTPRSTAYEVIPGGEIRALLTTIIKTEFDRLAAERLAAYVPDPDDPDDKPPQAKQVTMSRVSNTLQALSGICLVPGALDLPCWIPSCVPATEDASEKAAGDTGDARSPSPPDAPPTSLIALSNGLLDVRTLIPDSNNHDHGDANDSPAPPPAPSPHTPRFFSTICLPYAYDPDATAPRWTAFAERNLECDFERIELLQEWFGYCLTHDTSLQKFLIMEGEGSNGKSVICAALAALLGEPNVCHVPLERFGDRFSLTQTIGKLANIASEVGEIDRPSEGFLKSFTSGDRMTFDRKNKSAVDVLPSARLVLSTNNRPRFSDRSGGLWRRMILFPLSVVISDDEKVYGMDKPLFWQAANELPGLLNWAIAGLIRLRHQRSFTVPEICKSALAEYKDELNPVRSFLEDHYHFSQGKAVQTKELYHAYCKWCEDHGNKPLGDRMLGKEVFRVFPLVDRLKAGARGFRHYLYLHLDTGGIDEEEKSDDELNKDVGDADWFG